MAVLQLGDMEVEVVQKDIKNVHLTVHPPDGKVRVSAPDHMTMETIRVFVITKLGWIKRERKKLQAQARQTPREYLDRESHFVWGQRYLLKLVESDEPPVVQLEQKRLRLQVRPGTDTAKRHALVERWYRQQVMEAATGLVAKWEPRLGVSVSKLFVQRMKTKWGSCNPTAGNIRLNSQLGMTPRECLEYIVVHEMAHLLEPTHNTNFQRLLDQFLPNWREVRDTLNQTPLAHAEWAG